MDRKVPKTAFKKGRVPWNKGKKIDKDKYPNIGHRKSHSDETKKNWSISRKGKYTGKDSSQWKGGVTNDKVHRSWVKNRRNSVVKRLKLSGSSHTYGEWETLKAQYNFTCPCCNKREPEIKLTEDHIIPLSKGGGDNIENIQPLCRSCNCKKHTKIIKY